MIEKTLGHYDVGTPLGRGGMGEVYRAKDRKLGRDVAIKVLPEEFAKDADRVARLQREAKLLASLNHPNIAAIYGLEESSGTNFLVLELVEGETLADQIKRGPIPIEESLKLALQIADALEAAHEKGVIHRDLKPANIKVTPDGKVKVLDFGLAKAFAGEQADMNLSNSPTLSNAATQQGVILGTAAYMSTEQAKGKTVDKRADIWAFGVVLFEMLTGRQLFTGESVTETLAAVVKDQPDLSAVPEQVRRLLEYCLEKDPRKRLRDIGDVRLLLETPSPLAVSAGKTAKLGWTVAAMFALAAVTAIIGWLRTASNVSEIPGATLTIVPPAATIIDPVGNLISAPEISPDGAAVMYHARDATGGRNLFMRPLNSLEARRVPGSEKLTNAPFWSADSTTVVYPSGDLLMKVAMPDGAPQSIAKLTGASRGGSWSDEGTILIASGGLLSVPATGGELQPVDISAIGSRSILNPEFLPVGEDFLFLLAPDDAIEGESKIYLATLHDGKLIKPALLLKNATAAHYTPAGGGRILYVRDDNLYSQKLNRSARRLEGEAELVAKGIASQPGGYIARGDFSVARTGTLAWRPGRAASSQVTVFNRQGDQIGTAGPPGPITSVRISPNEKLLACCGQASSRWLLDVNQTGHLLLPGDVTWFGWSSEGSKLLGVRHAPDTLVEMPSGGSGEIRGLPASSRLSGRFIQDVSPDGKWILEMNFGSNSITAEQMQGAATEPKAVVHTGELVSSPRFSPDGQWIVYQARDLQNQTSVLYVQSFPEPGPRRQIAANGSFPEWRRDGKEILYIVPPGDIASIAVESDGNNLRFGKPQKLFSGVRRAPGSNSSDRPLAVSRDGSRIFLPQAVEQPDSNVIHIKMGWLK